MFIPNLLQFINLLIFFTMLEMKCLIFEQFPYNLSLVSTTLLMLKVQYKEALLEQH